MKCDAKEDEKMFAKLLHEADCFLQKRQQSADDLQGKNKVTKIDRPELVIVHKKRA